MDIAFAFAREGFEDAVVGMGRREGVAPLKEGVQELVIVRAKGKGEECGGEGLLGFGEALLVELGELEEGLADLEGVFDGGEVEFVDAREGEPLLAGLEEFDEALEASRVVGSEEKGLEEERQGVGLGQEILV